MFNACVEQDDDKPTAEDMKAVKSNILTAAPTPKYPVNADLEGKVVYLGMDVEPAIAVPGKELKLTHYWKSVASPGEGWKVFTHIEGPNHQGFINADHGPVGGKYPVGQWKAGEIIRDEHTITLPATWTHDSRVGLHGRVARSHPSDGEERSQRRFGARSCGDHPGEGGTQARAGPQAIRGAKDRTSPSRSMASWMRRPGRRHPPPVRSSTP